MENRIHKDASKHKNRYGFTRNFGSSGDDANWAARGYAKANLLGYQVKDENYDTGDQWDKMTMDLQSLRGFRDKDFDEIARLVEGNSFDNRPAIRRGDAPVGRLLKIGPSAACE